MTIKNTAGVDDSRLRYDIAHFPDDELKRLEIWEFSFVYIKIQLNFVWRVGDKFPR